MHKRVRIACISQQVWILKDLPAKAALLLLLHHILILLGDQSTAAVVIDRLG